MKRHGVNQSDVARHLCISQGSVSRWLKGAAPRVTVAGKLAEFLNCSIEWLLDGKGGGPGEFSPSTRHDFKDHEEIMKLPEKERLEAFAKLQNKEREKFPIRLRYLREKWAKQNINEFSRTVGCAPSYISRLERGIQGKPSIKFLDRLTECFGVNRLWLLYGERPAQFVPAKDAARVIPKVDIEVMEKLSKFDAEEFKKSNVQVTEMAIQLAQTMDAKQIASMIEMVEMWREKEPDIMLAVLKDLLVKKTLKP